ncbi:hypothetical protein AB833_04835 [Chromatiales bacterium (ex Bugula neritina AB1)]|nr:hypothetical protein AB833_04835 [Chromatiales bacterium (ex Bugula neritina AB1)]
MPKIISSEISEEQLTADTGDPQIARVVSRALQSSMTAPLVHRSIEEALSEHLNDDEVANLLAWYDTPLGNRIASANQTDQ